MKSDAALIVIGSIGTWAAFVAACTAHAVYYFKAANRLPAQTPHPASRWQPAQPAGNGAADRRGYR